MGQPIAKKGDQVTATDTHIVLVPSPGGPVPTPTPLPFAGMLDAELASSVLANEQPVATDGSKATNLPPHLPPGGPFQNPPSNEGKVLAPAGTVYAEDKVVAKNGDQAMTCNDPADLPVGTVIAAGTVFVG